MKHDIEVCKKLGCQGIVSGVLNPDHTIDLERTKSLIECSDHLQFTFHRAFDEVSNPEEGLEQLIALGVNRILSSGQQPHADDGIETLNRWHKIANGRIKIMPGSGINRTNAKLFKDAGFEEIHASASTVILQEGSLFFQPQTVSDLTKIKALLNEI